MSNVDEVINALQSTTLSPTGVSFAGKSLKLDTAEDAKSVVREIENCQDLQFLNLEGNTLGVDASEAIAKALEKHPEFKRALWKDMFTGRMKTEIPKALELLGGGLVTAGARLTELDMSDNAFGPIGVEGLASLLRSSSCYALEELRLNNNGLGITGGKLLAQALTDCYQSSAKLGKPLALKVFIAGRNRLENEGAKALAEVFTMIGTLEEIAMPQNGIYHVGITALSNAFTHNKNLEILNLNDNTFGKKGAAAIAKVLPSLQKLRQINFGDCLLKTSGVILLADGLKNGHTALNDLNLEHNEIRLKGALTLVQAMSDKTNLKSLNLNGNQFGKKGRTEIENELKNIGKFNTLGDLSEDESDNEDESDEKEESSEHSSTEDEDEQQEEVNVLDITDSDVKIEPKTVEDFLKWPSAETFLGLGDDRDDLILKEAKINGDISLDTYIPILMKVASLTATSKQETATLALKCSEKLYKELFIWSEKAQNASIVNNTILVNLGLIKSEDKKFKPPWNLEGGLKALKNVLAQPYVTHLTKDTLNLFISIGKNEKL